jgi:ABC-type ATPase involved in cell division
MAASMLNGRLAEQRLEFGNLVGEQVLILGFGIESEQRFGVGRADIEPPVVVLHRDAVEPIDLGVAVALFKFVERLALVGIGEVLLAAAGVDIQRLDQRAERLIPFASVDSEPR